MWLRTSLVLIPIAASLCATDFANAKGATPVCTVTVGTINFGNVNVLPGTAVDVAGTVDLNCSGFPNNETNRFCISIGSGVDFTGSQRKLAGPSSTNANYDLYTNAGRTTLWGSWQTGFDTAGLQTDLTSDGSGNLVTSIPLYARFFASQQTALPGSYSTSFPSSTAGVYVRFQKAGATQCDTGDKNAQTNMSVIATVDATCTVSATNVNFGTVGILSSNRDANNTVSPVCTNGTTYNIGLSAGSGSGATVASRKMTNGGATVTYSLYRDSNRSQVWGTTIGTNTVSLTGTGSTQNVSGYGRIPAQTTPAPAMYTDTIVVTVTY